MKRIQSLRLQNWIGLFSLSLLGLSCGGSGSSDYISVSSSSPAQLTTEQTNALNAVGASLGESTTSAASAGTSTALLRSASQDERSFPSTETFSGEDFESETIPCDTSGSTQASGSYSGSFTSDDSGRMQLILDITLTTTADNCVQEEGSFDGSVTATASIDMDIRINESLETTGTVETIVSMNGSMTAQGKDDAGDLQTVEIEYNNFKIRTLVDASDSESYAGFESLYDEEAADEEQLQFLRENLECSGSVTIDGETHDCGSILALMLEA